MNVDKEKIADSDTYRITLIQNRNPSASPVQTDSDTYRITLIQNRDI